MPSSDDTEEKTDARENEKSDESNLMKWFWNTFFCR
jgi:hypothetical protein